MQRSSVPFKIAVTLGLTGLLPCLVSWAALALGGETPRVQQPLHEGLELVGSCIALTVAMLLLLRARYEDHPPHLLWVVAALVTLGTVGGVHGLVPFGVAGTWLRHAATLAGGAIYALVWVPLPAVVVRRQRGFVLLVAVLALGGTLGIEWWADVLPAPGTAAGATFSSLVADGLGGLGFLAATSFFVRRYLRQPQTENLVFAGHTLLLGVTGLFVGCSHDWAADWWVWHAFRLLAYAIVLVAAYDLVIALYQRTAWHAEELEGCVQARTVELLTANTALQTEIAERGQLEDRAELEQRVQLEFLQQLNSSRTMRDLIEAVVRFVQQQSGCEAVGIRLQAGDDYPYFEVRGFPKEFVQAENSLCARNAAGDLVRDSVGNPVIECMCGNVICGRFDPAKPFFTTGGSFWTNSTTQLLASTTEADRQARTRNRCNGEGYESVALVPLCLGSQRLGLLQLNDRRRGMFSPETIALWERLAGYLAVALAKCRAEDALRDSEELYRSLFDHLLNGFAYCRMLYERGQPADFIYLVVNGAFEAQTGLSDVVGKKVSEVIPGIRESDPQLLEIYGRVASTGQPETFETYVLALQMWFSISVYSPARDHFAAVFDVITERKAHEREIERLNRLYAALSEVNEITVRALSREQLLTEVCQATARCGGFQVVWVGRHDPATHQVVPVARGGDDQGYLDQIQVYADDRPAGHGPVGTCIREGRTCIFNDFPQAAQGLPWHAAALAHGLRAVAALPIRFQGEVWGAFTVYDAEAKAFGDKEVALLERAAMDISFAMESLDGEQQRQRAETALRRSESALQVAQRLAQVGNWEWNPATDRPLWSQEMYRIYGRDPELGPADFQEVPKYFTPESWARLSAAVATTLTTGIPYECDVEVVRPDGTHVWTTARGEPAHDTGGKGAGLRGTVQDITERKRVEETLRQHARELQVRNRIAQVFLTVPDEELYAQVLAVVLEAVASEVGVFGYLDEQGDLVVPTMTGAVWDRCSLPDKRYVFPRATWGDSSWPRAIREKRTLCGNEMSALTPAGHLAIRRHVSLPLIHQDEVVGLLQVANKASDYSAEDVALLETIGRAIAPVLAARLQRERQEAALQHTLVELARSNRELEQFAYIASHDLQEPLRMVSSYTQLLAERYGQQLDGKAKTYIAYAVDGAVRMQQLVNDLLAYSRVGTRGGPRQPTDAQAALDAALKNLAVAIVEQQAVITYDALPTVPADAVQLVQVFQNLVGNALKFHGPDSPRIHVAAQAQDDEWVFSVQDNGIGIEAQYQEKLFVIFRRLHTRQEYPGTGIGLALCRHIVERHNGRIWFESQPGRGSTFFFALPR